MAPVETATREEPGKGYRVHRKRTPTPSVNTNSPSVQHVKSVNKLLFCTDVLSCKQFLVDTGASVSILNYKPGPNEPFEEFLCQADGSPVKTYGTVTKKIALGNTHASTDYTHVFLRANVDGPVLGSDFLAQNNLLVDCRRGQLVDGKSQQQPIACMKICPEDAPKAQISKVCCPDYMKSLISEFMHISGTNFADVKPKQERSAGVHWGEHHH